MRMARTRPTAVSALGPYPVHSGILPSSHWDPTQLPPHSGTLPSSHLTVLMKSALHGEMPGFHCVSPSQTRIESLLQLAMSRSPDLPFLVFLLPSLLFQTSSAQRHSSSARTTGVSPSSGCVTVAMIAGTAPTRRLTVVSSDLIPVQGGQCPTP